MFPISDRPLQVLKSSQLFSNSTRKAKALKTTISYKLREFENTSSTGLLGIAYIYNIIPLGSIWYNQIPWIKLSWSQKFVMTRVAGPMPQHPVAWQLAHVVEVDKRLQL